MTTAALRHAGARWWSIDIHAHSPGSFDFGGIEGQANDGDMPSYAEWIQAYINAGMDGLVVTDHNSHAGIGPARKALADLRQADPDLPPFVIFPGVELTVAGGTHLLGIFGPDQDAEHVNRVITLCGFSGTRGRSDETANTTAVDAARVIVNQGGICVPAHADQSCGVFGTDPRDINALAASGLVVAVEVIDDANIPDAGRRGWVPVLGSDAHHLTTDGCPDGVEPKAPGTHMTLIKAETLDLQGVQLALTDPDYSIRRCRRGYDDPNQTKHGHVDLVTVTQDNSTENYFLGPWLNCLIGGRGVGKSTLIELLRLSLGRTHELGGSVAQDLRRFQPSAEPGARWWNDTTRIVVHYTKDQRLLRVTWSGDSPHDSRLEVLEESGWQLQAGRVFDRVPIRVFSQKQIYELATSPRSFLTILDDMPPIQKSEWDSDFEHLQLELKGERNKLRLLLAEEENADRVRGQLEEVQGRLQHLAELQATEQYQELTSTETHIRAAATAEESSQRIEESVRTHVSELRELVTANLGLADYVDRSTSFTVAADLLQQAAVALNGGRVAWRSTAKADAWAARVQELDDWLGEQGGALSNAAQTQADRQREAELQAELREFETSDSRRQQQEIVIIQLLAELASKREELFRRRQQFARDLNATTSLTRVNIHEQGDIAGVGDELRALLNCPESFESAFSTTGIAASLHDKQPKHPLFPKEVDKFKSALVELVQSGSDSEIGQSLKVDARFYSRLAAADTFDLITEIMLWFPEDLVAVQYRASDSGNLMPIDRGSPGQKTAALLTVILQMGTDPLVLDQPEDDLENKLIKQLAVEVLKDIKTRRQIIVSTHNANIVVTSAAENIVVIQHGEPLPQIEAEGTLQVETVKKNVCVILEGGEDAIKTRYRRLVGPTS